MHYKGYNRKIQSVSLAEHRDTDQPGSAELDNSAGFGPEFTVRSHPYGIGLQWIGTVAGFECSIVLNDTGILAPAGSYELGYKTGAGEWFILNTMDPAVITEHLEKIRGSVAALQDLDNMCADDTAGDNS